MRRSKAAAGALLLLIMSAPGLGAQEVRLDTAVRNGIVCADIGFRWDREQEFLDGLLDGLESRITFTARLFDRRPSPLPFLGAVLVETRTFSQSAFFDFLRARFIVETGLGRRIAYEKAEDLIEGFFSMADITLAEWSEVRDCFVSARVQFEPVRLMPPLTIVSLMGAAGSCTTPWIQKDVKAQ